MLVQLQCRDIWPHTHLWGRTTKKSHGNDQSHVGKMLSTRDPSKKLLCSALALRFPWLRPL